jgi:hypothetical protein
MCKKNTVFDSPAVYVHAVDVHAHGPAERFCSLMRVRSVTKVAAH